jgi:hypothetical protein
LNKHKAIQELRTIPGVGPSIAEDLWQIGIRRVADLRDRDPQALYDVSCRAQGTTIDRCLLYVYRCAVYFTSRKRHDPELLKWWNWSDAKLARR